MAKMIMMAAEDVKREMLASWVKEVGHTFKVGFEGVDLNFIVPQSLPMDGNGNPVWPCETADENDRALAQYLGLQEKFLLAAGSYDRVSGDFILLPPSASPNILLVVIGQPEISYDPDEFGERNYALFYQRLECDTEERTSADATIRDLWVLPSVAGIQESLLRHAAIYRQFMGETP